MGPEIGSMEQNEETEPKTPIHEGCHCLAAYLLHKQGVYGNKPRKATVTRRGGALGHVSFMSDDKKDESSQSLEHLRSHLVVAMGGRAAEAIFAGEDKVCTGASSDMQQADGIMPICVGHCMQFIGENRKALELLTGESELHQLLKDDIMEFKTLDYDEIDLLSTSRSMKKLREQRDEAEKRRKSSTGGMSTLLGNILSKDDDKKGPN